MKLKVIVHQAEEGGYWAEVPAIPGCVSQGGTRENILEAIEGCLEVEFDADLDDKNAKVIEIAV
jgi:predicted RNase H-like HicB family nuclease